MLRLGAVLVSTVIIVSASTIYLVSAEEPLIPSWIKTTAGFWVDDQISDTEFLAALQYLVEEEILIIPEKEKPILTQKIPTFDSETLTYTNKLHGFTFNYPKDWVLEENPPTTSYGQAGIVSVGPYVGSSYEPNFIIHFFNLEEYEKNLLKKNDEQGLLEFYSDFAYQADASQVKFLDKSIKKTNDGYKILIKTTDVTYFPQEYINGEWVDEEFISLVNEYVFLVYSDGEEYDLYFVAEPKDYEKFLMILEKLLKVLKDYRN